MVDSDRVAQFQARERLLANQPPDNVFSMLIGSALEGGGAALGLTEQQQHALRDLGHAMGTMFQAMPMVQPIGRPVVPTVPEIRPRPVEPPGAAYPRGTRRGELAGLYRLETGPDGRPVPWVPLNEVNQSAGRARGLNCPYTAVATDHNLRGLPTIVTTRDTRGLNDAEVCRLFYPGRRFVDVESYQQVNDRLRDGGHGATAIVGVTWTGATGRDVGHYFNAINWHGEIFYADGQTGDWMTHPWNSYRGHTLTFLRTH